MKTYIPLIMALANIAPAYADTPVAEPHFARDNTGIESVVLDEKSPLTLAAQEIFRKLAAEGGGGIETKSFPRLGSSGLFDGEVNQVATDWFLNQRASENGSEK